MDAAVGRASFRPRRPSCSSTPGRSIEQRLELGVAREQARKDLPLSTYTEAYWKIDLHNLLHFLHLRMDAHAQWEIRQYAETIGQEIVRPLFPLVWEAFVDYRLEAVQLSRLDREVIARLAAAGRLPAGEEDFLAAGDPAWAGLARCRERDECREKLIQLGTASQRTRNIMTDPIERRTGDDQASARPQRAAAAEHCGGRLGDLLPSCAIRRSRPSSRKPAGNWSKGWSSTASISTAAAISGPHNTTICSPHVRLLGDVAVVCYVRLVQRLDDAGKPVTHPRRRDPRLAARRRRLAARAFPPVGEWVKKGLGIRD